MSHEHHLQITRTARYFTLGAPSGPVKQLWIACHGYGQSAARFLRHFAPIDDGTRLIAAPEALSRFYLEDAAGGTHAEAKVGASWMTREDRLSEIEDYINYLDALAVRLGEDHDLSRARVIALGFSQGVATVCRWVERGRTKVDEVVLWAGAMPPDMDLERPAHPLRALRPAVVVGSEDAYASPEAVAQHEQRLRERGISYDLIRFAGGHRLDYDTLRALAARWD